MSEEHGFWTITKRLDGTLEAVCPHGVGHPIPGTSKSNPDGIHGCDGCCSREDFPYHVKSIRQARKEGYSVES